MRSSRMSAPSPDPPPRAGVHLGDSLALVLPALGPQLVSPDSVAKLVARASVLPPVHRAGFECRLAPGDQRVDLQQGIFRNNAEPVTLERFLASAGTLTGAWERVRSLCETWATATSSLHDGISELWLEIDIPTGSCPEPAGLTDLVPSVFAVLEPTDAVASLAIARELIETLADRSSVEGLGAALARCASPCQPPARLSHVGLMLGRTATSMRVHISALPLRALVHYLSAIPWPGDAAEARSLAGMLLDHGDSLALCLDVVGDVLPRLGLECFFAQNHGLDPRWPKLLGRLTALGLSSSEKADALLRWPGVIVPPNAPADWPEDLIVRSLTAPESTLGVIDRRLSHVKLTCASGQAPSAKAYFGFGHVWLHAAEAPKRPRPAPPLRPAGSLGSAIDAGVDYLLGRRNQAGWWRDFFDRARPSDEQERVTAYASDEWVTAYVAATLAGVDRPRARAAAVDALDLLLGRRDSRSGWGYHALLPEDADTTTWVLRLAAALEFPPTERLRAARRFVMSLIGPTGGVATYRASDAAALDEFLRIGSGYAGWCGTHACVTAAAGVLDLEPDPAGYLLHAQRPDGSWAGHWWDDPEYTTTRAVEALAPRSEHGSAVASAVAWSAGRVGPDGSVFSTAHGDRSPFATALALQAILAGQAHSDGRLTDPISARATSWLLAQQRADGSWQPAARLRVPAPDAIDPLSAPERTLTYVDDDAVFTTATVLAALAAVPVGAGE